MNTESEVIDVVAQEVEKLTEETPSPGVENNEATAQEKMKLISAEVGNAYIQDAARLLANIAGTVGSPLSFAYNTQTGGKALVFAISSTTEEIQKLARIIDAAINAPA